MIAIRVDGNGKIGMGHISRCVAIFDQIIDLGETAVFLISEDTNPEVLGERKKFCVIIKNLQYLLKWIKCANPNRLLIDSYTVNYLEMELINSFVSTYYLDDLNMFTYPVDGIINYNVEASESMYKKGAYNKLYIGPTFFPAKKELFESKINLRKTIKKVLITNGSTDSLGIVENIVKTINLNNYADMTFYILEGLFFNNAYKNQLKNLAGLFKNLVILPWGQNMAKVYSSSDLVIAPGSTTIFEALTVGVPCISFNFVENQKSQCICMDELKICPYAGNMETNMDETLDQIKKLFSTIQDFNLRSKYREVFDKLFDGKGARRIAEGLLK